MSSHPTDFQGSVIDALRKAIEQQIPNSRAAVSGGDGHFSIEVTSPAFAGRIRLERHWLVYLAIVHLLEGDASPVHAIDSLKTRTPARFDRGVADHGWLRPSPNAEHPSLPDLVRTES